MSVTTTADERLDDAKRGIREAVLSLNEILVGECWGHDQWNEEYRAKMREAYAALLRLRDQLGP